MKKFVLAGLFMTMAAVSGRGSEPISFEEAPYAPDWKTVQIPIKNEATPPQYPLNEYYTKLNEYTFAKTPIANPYQREGQHCLEYKLEAVIRLESVTLSQMYIRPDDMALYADVSCRLFQELAPSVKGTIVNVDIYRKNNPHHFFDFIDLGVNTNQCGIPSSLTVLFSFSPAQYDPQKRTLEIPIQLKGLFEGLRQPTSSPYMQVSSQTSYDPLQALLQLEQSSQSQTPPPPTEPEVPIQPSLGNNQERIPLNSFGDFSSPDFQDPNSFIPRSTNNFVWHGGMDGSYSFSQVSSNEHHQKGTYSFLQVRRQFEQHPQSQTPTPPLTFPSLLEFEQRPQSQTLPPPVEPEVPIQPPLGNNQEQILTNPVFLTLTFDQARQSVSIPVSRGSLRFFDITQGAVSYAQDPDGFEAFSTFRQFNSDGQNHFGTDVFLSSCRPLANVPSRLNVVTFAEQESFETSQGKNGIKITTHVDVYPDQAASSTPNERKNVPTWSFQNLWSKIEQVITFNTKIPPLSPMDARFDETIYDSAQQKLQLLVHLDITQLAEPTQLGLRSSPFFDWKAGLREAIKQGRLQNVREIMKSHRVDSDELNRLINLSWDYNQEEITEFLMSKLDD